MRQAIESGAAKQRGGIKVSDNEIVVEAFVKAFNEKNLEAIMAFFEEDAIYHNIPVDPVRGAEAIKATLSGFLDMSTEIDWVVHQLAENSEGCVLTERTDRFLIGEKWIEIKVMGTFEIHDGRIRAWRDYFDMNQFQSQLAG